MKPIIEFDHFSFKYRSQQEPSLHDISLKIYPGEKILIAGPSGSGKSTLAHCINALVPCSIKGTTTGSLTVDGVSPSKEGIFGMSRRVGTVLQDTDGQFIGMTVAEDLAFALENEAAAQSDMKARVDEIAELVNVSDLLRHSPGELSGGQKQRVSLGGVLVEDVSILLFDEPLANLDPAAGKKTIELIDDILKKKELTVLIVEHRLEDVLYRDIDRIILINDGRIIADRHPDELLSTNLLGEQGIREPLYVTAIKHAGCTIAPEDRPQHIESMDLQNYRNTVRTWFHASPIPPVLTYSEPALELKGISFGYHEHEHVLSDINFSVSRGEMVAIVGKNGAGKSTTASLICGFYKPTAGSILVNGSDISGLSIKERGEKIGFVMQSPNDMISKPMIMDEVALGLRVRGVPESEVKTRVEDTLRICGLYPFRNWPVSALSFGQKKRVTIASILVMQPDILILDEPTAGQDYHHYTEIMEFLKMLHERMHLTILMITHDMHLMLEYTDRALVLADGQLIADDTPAKILTDETITERANLKKTSLYDLAVRCGIDTPYEFVERFIDHERALRENQSENRKEVDPV